MSGYLIRVWCDTCFDDSEGCFPGGSETWGNGPGDDGPPFETKEAAEEFAYARIRHAPWDFEIIEAP